MKHLSITAVTAGIAALGVGALGLPAAIWAQGSPERPGAPWGMMHGWGTGGFWLMPLVMMTWFAVLVAVIILLVRWLGGGPGVRSTSSRTARDILDERYARGEIDQKEYLQRKRDIGGND
jgi:putative membrane protein